MNKRGGNCGGLGGAAQLFYLERNHRNFHMVLGEPDCPRVLTIEHTDYANRVLFEAVLYAPLELLDVGQHGVNELLVKGMFSTRNDLRHKQLWDVPRDFLLLTEFWVGDVDVDKGARRHQNLPHGLMPAHFHRRVSRERGKASGTGRMLVQAFDEGNCGFCF